MSENDKKAPPGAYEVGYGKPPPHSRFRKGQSGNPTGRPRGMSRGRTSDLALKEAFRLVSVREGDKVTKMPAMQAVLRSLVAFAAKGSGPAQRALIELVRVAEQETKTEAAAQESSAAKTKMSDIE